jgi:hypothetical protein
MGDDHAASSEPADHLPQPAPPWTRYRRQRGAAAAEYLGVIVVVAAIIAAIAVSPIGAQVSGGLAAAICRITGITGCDTTAAAAGGPGTNAPGSAAPAGSSSGGPQVDAGPPLTVTVTDDTGCHGALDCTGSALAGFGHGVWTGVRDEVTGTWSLITDPGQLIDAGKAIWDDPARAAKQFIWDDESEAMADEGDKAGAGGRTAWNIGSWFIPGVDLLKISKIEKLSKLTKLTKLNKIVEAAERAGKAADNAEAAASAGRKADAAAREARQAADDAEKHARDLGCPIALAPLGGPTGIGGGAGRGTPPATPQTLIPSTSSSGCGEAREDLQKARADADRAEAAAKDADQPGAMTDPAFTKGPLGKDFRPGVHDPSNGFSTKERAIAEYLADKGARVDHRVADHTVPNQKNPDAMVRWSGEDAGRITEFKTMESPTNKAVQRLLLDSTKQSVDRAVVLDGRNVGLTKEEAVRGWSRAAGQARAHGQTMPDVARIILGDGSMLVLP